MMQSSMLQFICIVLLSINQVHGFLSGGVSHHDNGNRIRLTRSRAKTKTQQESSSQPPQKGDSEDPFGASGAKDLMTTMKGGLSNIFEYAAEQRARNKRRQESRRQRELGLKSSQQSNGSEQPRWHPYSGINSSNPNFRTAAPVMTNAGFAKSIWRNVRKRNKPVLWKNALRTYDRMAILEEKTELEVTRMNLHHEGAMLACAKLGLWQKCLEIYHLVDEHDSSAILPPTASSRLASSNLESTSNSKISRRVYVTDNMIQSLIRACARASHQRAKGNKGKVNQQTKGGQQLEESEAALRRIPLDTALEIVRTMEENHGVKPGAMHINPLAAAYQSLGYVEQARDLLQIMLSNRTAGEEPEDGVDIVNVNDLCAKDKGSYSLLVQGAVASGDWGAAVEALSEMTKAGLYPNPRHCNSWNEISERHRGRSWKKKRDDFWTNSVI